MAIKLNRDGFLYAQNRISSGDVDTLRGLWKDHKATEDEVDKFLETHSMYEYGQWFLGVDTDIPENSKEHYVLPYGDLKMVHKDGVEAVEHEAEQKGYKDIAQAAHTLLTMIKDSTEH